MGCWLTPKGSAGLGMCDANDEYLASWGCSELLPAGVFDALQHTSASRKGFQSILAPRFKKLPLEQNQISKTSIPLFFGKDSFWGGCCFFCGVKMSIFPCSRQFSIFWIPAKGLVQIMSKNNLWIVWIAWSCCRNSCC